jgi:DNA-binding HxlR family transcriptional regulator
LLIIRELLIGPKRFSDLVDRLGGVSPTMLTTRLTALIENGLVQRTTLASAFNAQVYELTPIGRDLKPAIRELIRWGGHFLFPMRPDDQFEPDWVVLALDAIARRTPTPEQRIVLRLRHKAKAASFLVEGGPSGTTVAKGEGPGAAAIETRFDALLRIIATDLSIDQAMADEVAKVEGSLKAARALPRLFDLADRRGRR